MIPTFEQYTSYNRIEKIVKSSADKLADIALDNIDWEFLKNATDLNECDETDISRIISLANNDTYLIDELNEAPYNIQDICNKEKHVECIDAIDSWVEENWEDYLEEDAIEALHDYFDIGGIVGKKQLNGGRFESFRDFQILVSSNVINKIKENLL